MTLTFLWVVLFTFIAGVVSVWIAASLALGVLANKTQQLLSFAAGALLTTALLHVLPEAFEGQTEFKGFFVTILLSVLFFFLLDKVELWHHGHEHHHDTHYHKHIHQHDHSSTGPGIWAVLSGDSLHCFGDGLMLAASFAASFELGLLASIAVFAHEIPHHMGDLMVVGGRGQSNKKLAVLKVSLAGGMTVLGGIAGSALMVWLKPYLPYVMCITASSFIYVALADLVPQLQKKLSLPQTIQQVFWLIAGIVLIYLASILPGA